MSILFGIIGFAAGFSLGQFILFRLLRDLTREDVIALLSEDKSARVRFGLLNWGLATAGAALAVAAWHAWLAHQ